MAGSRSRRAWSAVAAVTLAGMAGSAMVGSALADERTKGEFAPFASAAPGKPNHRAFGGIEGRAEMLRTEEGTTEVTAEVSGLAPDHEYPVHVHEAPCHMNSAAGHYKHHPSGPPVPPNEIWPGPVAANDDGDAYGETVAPYVAREEAQSVVVHAPNGDKLACADLESGSAALADHEQVMGEEWIVEDTDPDVVVVTEPAAGDSVEDTSGSDGGVAVGGGASAAGGDGASD